MPVRFDGRKDLIGMFLLFLIPSVIAMILAIWMSPEGKLAIVISFLIAVFCVFSVLSYKKRKKKS
jgi:putative effector of murein hydrolase LrgA (UPF0299 family)